jgi:phosphoenolpyruvate synthase/pyruvate phosphate dikinase
MIWVVGLGNISRDQESIVGGKGANLGELIQQGLPVPPGLVVTAESYREHIKDLDLTHQTPYQIRYMIMNQQVDSNLEADLQQHHGQLSQSIPREYVYAVRSSATAEDLADASLAGQHDTYYYVTADQTPKMVKKCWASLWSDSACRYRECQGIAHHTVNMAIEGGACFFKTQRDPKLYTSRHAH